MVENIILSIYQNTILSYAIKQNRSFWEKQFGRNDLWLGWILRILNFWAQFAILGKNPGGNNDAWFLSVSVILKHQKIHTFFLKIAIFDQNHENYS